MINLYNDIRPNVEGLHDVFDMRNRRGPYQRINPVIGLLRFIMVKALYKMGLFCILIDAGVVRGWFKEFVAYWSKELKGRPLSIHDFHFLRSHYRTKFTLVEVEDESDTSSFAYAWQRPENIYSTFAGVYKAALDPVIAHGYLPFIKSRDNVLEYGCGVAPITSSLLHYFSYKNVRCSIADIRGFPFHFAKCTLAQYGVTFYNVEPYKEVSFKETFDIILLITVMEHLPDPEKVVASLTQALDTGGKLIFDYIYGDGTGLDTKEAVKKRKYVLDYINKHYHLAKGSLNYNSDMGLTVAVKK